MDRLSELLKYIQKINPEMNEGKLIKELSKNRCSSTALIMTLQGSKILENLSS